MILGAVAALVLLASWLLVAWCAARWLAPEDAAIRGLAALVALPWLLNGAFWILAGVGLFRLEVALVGSVVAALAAAMPDRKILREAIRSDVARLGRIAGVAFRGWTAVVSIPLVLLALLRGLRGSLLPPLAWDALTYRLFKAGTWVQSGSRALDPSPDAWGYYRFFPASGEVLWAWAMLPFSSAAGIAAAGLVLWLGLVLAVALAGRTLGASRSASVVTSLAVGAMPVLLSFVGSAYVHALASLAVLAGAALTRDFFRRGGPGSGIAAAAAFGLAAATHLGALPLVAVGICALAVGAVRRRSWRTAGAMALATAIAWPWFGLAALETGSPVYPLEIRVAGLEVFEGHPQLGRLHRGEPFGPQVRLPPVDLVALQLWDPGAPRQEMLSLGPGAGILLLLAVAGWAVWWRTGRVGPVLVLLLSLAALLPALSGAAGAMRTPWGAPMLGRHLLPGVLCLVWAGTILRSRWAQLARGAAALLGIAWGWPRGFGAVSWRAMGDFVRLAAPGGLLALAIALALWRLGRPRLGALLAAGTAILASMPAVDGVRDAWREPAWRAAAEARVYDLHPLSPGASAAWPLWEAVADAPSRRIAYAAGWDGIGHNWYRFPFLGSRLQHRVVYVPVAADGRVVDYEDMESVVRSARFEAWLRRLVDRRVDFLAAAPPDTLEGLWADDHPGIFHPVARAGGGALYRVDRDAAEARLGGR